MIGEQFKKIIVALNRIHSGHRIVMILPTVAGGTKTTTGLHIVWEDRWFGTFFYGRVDVEYNDSGEIVAAHTEGLGDSMGFPTGGGAMAHAMRQAGWQRA